MSYNATFLGWQALTLSDLIVAYRKAKADCFFENTFPTAINFSDYEQDLLANLETLLQKLKKENDFSNDEKLLGKYRVVPKKLAITRKPESRNGHIHFSDPDRAFECIVKNNNLVAEFRVIGDFPVETHIISALWINAIGHKFDSHLEKCCYGARLKRIRDDKNIDQTDEKPFHIKSTGSFVPYFQPYQRWRNDGLKAIRIELEQDRDVVAVSLDLKSYYHFIDPMAIASKALHETLDLALSEDEQQFTKQLAKFLSKWSQGASKFAVKLALNDDDKPLPGGLAIGLTATRIISNVLLQRWDQLIKQKVTPIHYGRYVDDMFLVMHDNGRITNTDDFMIFLQDRLGKEYLFKEGKSDDEGLWEIQQGKDIQKKTRIRLQADKQKLFILHGQAGIDLLDSIEKEIRELSSEHRLMPSPDQLEDSTAARVLAAAGDAAEQADTLRRADGLTIRRLSWSLQLRHVETLARDLPPIEWAKQRAEFYQFSHNHILRPDSLFAQFNYIPRLLGFAISLNEWMQAERIANRAFESIKKLEEKIDIGSRIVINGKNTKAGVDLWRYVTGTLAWLFIDAAARYYDPKRLLSKTRSKREARLAKLFVEKIFEQLTSVNDLLEFELISDDFYKKAPLLAIADLAKEPYKRILRGRSAPELIALMNKKKGSQLFRVFKETDLLDTDEIRTFLKSSRSKRLALVVEKDRRNESELPYIFPTRPYTPAEIAELAPECVGLKASNRNSRVELPAIIWAKYTQALRGVWIKPTLLAIEQEQERNQPKKYQRRRLFIGTEQRKKIVVALTNIKTDDSDWQCMASGKTTLSLQRYKRISNLINQTVKLNPKPDYVLFPELSVPLEWIESISARLSAAKISLIAGTEYRHFAGNKIISEACLVLSDNRLGFPASVKIWQPKLEPAVGEEKELTSKYGKSWFYPESRNTKIKPKPPKPIYFHNGIHFGLMVCSELQNSKERIGFQGEVDVLMVLSWNQDLDTFSALIESAALDVHAYTILVNNRKYGDSRVRSPAKESFMRDLARVRGGDNDFVIAATLDIDALRAFQSRAKRWPEESDKYKPLPEGFKLNTRRRKLPPA